MNVLFASVQRKEYSENLNREDENHFRVEVKQPTHTNGHRLLALLTPSLCDTPSTS